MEISPLFAVDAEELLEQGKVQEAIDLCLNGLEVYPGYPAGEATLAKCYKLSGNSEKANEILNIAIQKNPFNKALDTLKKYDLDLSNIEKIQTKRSKTQVKNKRFPDSTTDNLDNIENVNSVEEFQNKSFNSNINSIEETTNVVAEELDINNFSENHSTTDEIYIDYQEIDLIPGINQLPIIPINQSYKPEFIVLSFSNFPIIFNNNHKISLLDYNVDEYMKLADNLKVAKIKITDKEFPEPINPEIKIEDFATETMAKIFFDQGKHNEAIKAYTQLTKKYPDKKEDYAKKIDLIEQEKLKELEIKNKFK